MDELVVIYSDDIFMWPIGEGGKRTGKQYLGRLILTNERLLYLSYREYGSIGPIKVSAEIRLPKPENHGLYLNDFDLSPMRNEGSFNAPLHNIRSFDIKDNFIYGFLFPPVITIRISSFIGEEGDFQFWPNVSKARKWARRFMGELKEMKERFG